MHIRTGTVLGVVLACSIDGRQTEGLPITPEEWLAYYGPTYTEMGKLNFDGYDLVLSSPNYYQVLYPPGDPIPDRKFPVLDLWVFSGGEPAPLVVEELKGSKDYDSIQAYGDACEEACANIPENGCAGFGIRFLPGTDSDNTLCVNLLRSEVYYYLQELYIEEDSGFDSPSTNALQLYIRNPADFCSEGEQYGFSLCGDGGGASRLGCVGIKYKESCYSEECTFYSFTDNDGNECEDGLHCVSTDIYASECLKPEDVDELKEKHFNWFRPGYEEMQKNVSSLPDVYQSSANQLLLVDYVNPSCASEPCDDRGGNPKISDAIEDVKSLRGDNNFDTVDEYAKACSVACDKASGGEKGACTAIGYVYKPDMPEDNKCIMLFSDNYNIYLQGYSTEDGELVVFERDGEEGHTENDMLKMYHKFDSCSNPDLYLDVTIRAEGSNFLSASGSIFCETPTEVDGNCIASNPEEKQCVEGTSCMLEFDERCRADGYNPEDSIKELGNLNKQWVIGEGDDTLYYRVPAVELVVSDNNDETVDISDLKDMTVVERFEACAQYCYEREWCQSWDLLDDKLICNLSKLWVPTYPYNGKEDLDGAIGSWFFPRL
ncbi:hypothetical protein SARC_12006 [Sphaeroforma arctica JP610]|uniref:Uncharacterized protein n=1 Tax=Sphaeroforma arctica JP610 TaxID=667725 RepID=A0A0L0FFE1_9EUKA|nr:hypothetical protein SARC_12006 [Sphaeroforma arctica JP610]KNC75470.1 hypothetical protein SARC_12006 [Sphaeroforma arctica JP610]|eukprot:XP_014149372.1 hypothetical protein SARC_12006 [Sphaeroforma arctica JP610]